MLSTMSMGMTTTKAMTTAPTYEKPAVRSLLIALVLITGFMIAEVIGGILSGSLALLADAAHMVADAAAIALALLALWVSGRPASVERTFGYHRGRSSWRPC